MDELISIIVPIYKVENYIRRCVDSILNQTYENLEIILVNDGSPDGCAKICDEYAIKDSRIKVIHKNNEGLGFARNAGLDCATGKYITFIDGDDYIGSEHLEKMYRSIKKTGTDTCLGGHTKVYREKEVKHYNVCVGSVYRNDVIQQILPRMCGADNNGSDYIEMSVCMALFSNDIIQNNNLRFVSEREFISEDLVFDFEYYPLSEGVCVVDSIDYYYCDNDGSLTTRYRHDRFQNQIELYKYLIEKSQNLGLVSLCKPRLQNTVIAIARYSIKLEYKFSDKLGRNNVNNNIKKICENKTLESIFAEYSDNNLKLTSRMVNFFIKKKKYVFLSIAMKTKNLLNI